MDRKAILVRGHGVVEAAEKSKLNREERMGREEIMFQQTSDNPGRRLRSRRCGGRTGPFLGGALAASLMFAGTTASAQEYEFTLAVLPSPNTAYSGMTSQIPERIAEATDGRVEITLNDSIVGGPEIASGVRDGRVPMSAALHTYLAGDEPRMGIFNLPGLIENMPEFKFVGDAFWFEDIAEIMEDRWNSVVLAQGAWCTQQLFSKEPIRTVEDFEGKRLRVHNPQTASLMEELGARPVPLALSEVMPSLDRGVIDGLFTSTCYGHGQEYWREAEYVQNWRLGPITGWMIIANNDEWAELPEDLQETIRDEMADFQDEALHTYYDYVRQAMDEMRAEGVEFWVVPQEEMERIFSPQYTDPVFETWYEQAEERGFDGEAYVERVRQTLGKDLVR